MFPKRTSKLNSPAKRIGLTLGIAAFVLSASARAATIYACVNDSTGAIVIVSATHTCSSNQHKISWNLPGSQGPPGFSVGYAAKSDKPVYLNGIKAALVTPTVQHTGTYYINAAAVLYIDSGDTAAACWVATNSTTSFLQSASTLTGAFQQVAVSDFLHVTAGQQIALVCNSGKEDPGTFVNDAGLIALPIQAGTLAGPSAHASAQNRSAAPK